jgi:voltage-gated potassium channel
MKRDARWARYTEWPLMFVAIAFLTAYAVPIIDSRLDRDEIDVFHALTWVAWAVFVVDYVVRLVLAERRMHYFKHHLLDLAIIALPLLRPLRLLRLVTLLTVINRRASTGLRGRVVVYVAGGSVLLAFCGALAVLDAERYAPNANITTFGDAAWWAVTTMTTVGYGDRYPVTLVGRFAAAALMVGGIALLGVVTATLASWLVERVTITEQRQTSELSAQLEDLRVRLDEISRQLSAQPPSIPAQSDLSSDRTPVG